ncbi:Adenine phosphoribosyltransferase 5 isoform 1 [Hibiscus syriacus]|uniref:Adenine phosphoribosyltransferase 5 isoform 1 n=1 Tax=Hibiscus syriacus TaxID=106335 RepID=A0A6A2XZG2_HIBSY|nr:Adenine phosphoribosyltransferase 5 isoform 1 [Hibiscus syriacus]
MFSTNNGQRRNDGDEARPTGFWSERCEDGVANEEPNQSKNDENKRELGFFNEFRDLLHGERSLDFLQRRCSLEEWMTKLLSDIDLSRSVTVASFLELEVAARSSVQDLNECSSKANIAENSTISSNNVPPNSAICHFAGNSSITSDYGSDSPYETSELVTLGLGRDDSSEIGSGDLTVDEDLTGSIEKLVKYGISNIDEGLFMGQAILEQLEDFHRHKSHAINMNDSLEKDVYNGNGSRSSLIAGNGLELFSEIEPDKVAGHTRNLSTESVGSGVSSLRGSDMSIYGIPNSSFNGSHDLSGNSDPPSSGVTQIVLPLDQRHKMNSVLLTMKRRLVTAETDMEDLMGRLNQEIAVKGYLMTKDEKQITETINQSAAEEKDAMLQELNATKEQLNDAQLEQGRKIMKHVRNEREKLLKECQLLHNRLLECSMNLSTDDENLIKDSSSVEALDLLTTSDDKISLLLAEVQLLAKEEGNA